MSKDCSSKAEQPTPDAGIMGRFGRFNSVPVH